MVTVVDAGPPVGLPARPSNIARGDAAQALKKLRARARFTCNQPISQDDLESAFEV